MKQIECQDILSQFANPVLLDQGGQKVVYRTTHPIYGDVALKIGIYSSPEGLERIEREVSTLREIISEYYPKNFDFQKIPGNRFLIIEEYINSKPLSLCFPDFKESKKILILIRELVLGLKILWNKNIVHRDIKPQNILITQNGSPKIIDLGIARLLDMDSLTHPFAVRGPCTPNYAAPEQLRNQKSELNHRTDQFNLGIVMLQLLLDGKHPFDPELVGSGSSIVDNILSNKWFQVILEQANLSTVKPIAKKILANEPFLRYRTPDLFLNELNRCIETLK